MACTPKLNSDDYCGSTETLIQGEKRRLSINLYQPKDNSALEYNCNPQRNDLVIPPTFVVTAEQIDIYSEDDLTTPIITDTPSKTDIFDSTPTLIGVKLSYVIDTTISGIDTVGSYIAVFTYTIDGSEVFKSVCYFDVVAIGFAGNC